MSGVFVMLLGSAGGGAAVVTAEGAFGGAAISVEPFG